MEVQSAVFAMLHSEIILLLKAKLLLFMLLGYSLEEAVLTLHATTCIMCLMMGTVTPTQCVSS